MTDSHVSIAPAVAKALLGIAPKADSRRYLNALHIEPLSDGAAVIATDGAVFHSC